MHITGQRGGAVSRSPNVLLPSEGLRSNVQSNLLRNAKQMYSSNTDIENYGSSHVAYTWLYHGFVF